MSWRHFCAASYQRHGSSTSNARPIGFESQPRIDLVITDARNSQAVAIELKCPRQGQHPEQMFKACQDLQFLEQLVGAGFDGGLFAMHVGDRLFYEGDSNDGIYAHFRAGLPIHGSIQKPTGARNAVVSIRGSYRPVWTPSKGPGRYWLQAIAPLGA